MFEFLFSTEVPQDSIITFAFNFAGISEGNESFIHRLIRLICVTRDDLDKIPTTDSQYFMHNTQAELIHAPITHLMLLH